MPAKMIETGNAYYFVWTAFQPAINREFQILSSERKISVKMKLPPLPEHFLTSIHVEKDENPDKFFIISLPEDASTSPSDAIRIIPKADPAYPKVEIHKGVTGMKILKTSAIQTIF